MERGYVKLWRKTLDSGLLMNPTAWQMFGYLLLKATRTKRKMIFFGQAVELNPGDYITSRKNLSEELGLSERNVRTALSLLEKLEIVTIKATNKFTVVSFVKWATYQEDCPADRPAERPTGDQQPTSNRPAGDQRVTSLLKQEREKERKRELISSPPSPPQGGDEEREEGESAKMEKSKGKGKGRQSKAEKQAAAGPVEYSEDFEKVWHWYPRKDNKQGAFAAWQAYKAAGQLPDDMYQRVTTMVIKRDWDKPENKRFVPHMQTWLNRRGWEEDDCIDKDAEPYEPIPDWWNEKRAAIEAEFKPLIDECWKNGDWRRRLDLQRERDNRFWDEKVDAWPLSH